MLSKTKDQIENLNKLYQLYNSVNEKVGNWEEELWSEIEPSMVTVWEEEVQKFSELCQRLPKPLREW